MNNCKTHNIVTVEGSYQEYPGAGVQHYHTEECSNCGKDIDSMTADEHDNSTFEDEKVKLEYNIQENTRGY